MKLIMAIINDGDVKEVTKSMMQGGFYVTKIGSSGGFLRNGVTTIMSAVHDEQKEAALEILRTSTHNRKYNVTEPAIDMKMMPSSQSQVSEIVVGGATVFVLKMEEQHKF